MSKRRGRGTESIHWDASRDQYSGAVDLGLSPAGTRIREKVSGKTKVGVRDKLQELHKETDAGLRGRRQRPCPRRGSAGARAQEAPGSEVQFSGVSDRIRRLRPNPPVSVQR